MTGFTCEHCKPGQDAEAFLEVNRETFLLCLACLTEVAWKLRESQPKLSKSKPKKSGHLRSCPAYGNYQPPYEECDCGYEEDE